MKIEVGQEFKKLLAEIASEGKSAEEWSEIESDDMFQSDHFIGGFDADEQAFCFSYQTDAGDEFWFQFDLGSVDTLLQGRVTEVEGRPADK